MKIVTIVTQSPLQNYTHVLLPEGEGAEYSALVIDPYDANQVEAVLIKEKRRPDVIINTHEHPDHTCGNAGLLAKSDAEVWAHPRAMNKVPGFSRGLQAGEEIEVSASETLYIMDTPGHTMSHVCVLVLEQGEPKAVITGDTLFNAGVGNCKNGGDPRVLFQTIENQFGPLPDDVRVYPGHDYMQRNLEFSLHFTPENAAMKKLASQKSPAPVITDMGLERQVNQFFRLEEADLQQALKKQFPAENLTDREEVFLRLRQLRDSW